MIINQNSPYARIARIALAEKDLTVSDLCFVNPWGDDAELMRLNPASKIPTLELSSGRALTESLLILFWSEKVCPEPSLVAGDFERILSLAGRAMGVIEAMTNLVSGRTQIDAGFEDSRVGRKRVQTVVNGFRALEADAPTYLGGVPDIAVLTAVVAVDYRELRFSSHSWIEPIPRLSALRDAVASRPAYADSRPQA